MALKKLPKSKKVKELEEQDKVLAGLPDPKKEKKVLVKTGKFLKRLIGHKSVESKADRIEKEEHEDVKEIKKEERKIKKAKKKSKKKAVKKKVPKKSKKISKTKKGGKNRKK